MTPPSDGSRLDAIPTLWSVVRGAHAAGAPASAVAARQALVLRYAKAIRRYVGGVVRCESDADELAQEVVVKLMTGDFGGADPDRGRFRDLLKAAVRNLTRNHWAKQTRRRGTDAAVGRLAAPDEAADAWDAEWRRTVLDHAWATLQSHERANPTPPTFTLLRLRADCPDATGDELAAALAAKTGRPVRADACRQLLRRARLRFADALVPELRAGLADQSPARVTEELAALGLLEYVKEMLPESG